MYCSLSDNIKNITNISADYIKETLLEKYKNKYSEKYLQKRHKFLNIMYNLNFLKVIKYILFNPRMFFVLVRHFKVKFWLLLGEKYDRLIPVTSKDYI